MIYHAIYSTYGMFFTRTLLPCLLLLSMGSTAAARTVDQIAAIVDDDIITRSEVKAEIRELHSILSQKDPSADRPGIEDQLWPLALDKRIGRLLVQQRAKKLGISVSKKEVDEAYQKNLEQMGLNEQQLAEELAAAGISIAQYKKRLWESILQSKVLGREVRSKIVITDQMIQEYYAAHYITQVDDGDFYLLQIGFTWEPEQTDRAKRPEVLKLAQRVHRLAKGGGDFKTLAKRFSQLPSAVDGGDIGVFDLEEMAPEMRAAVKDLKEGEVSAIVEMNNGFQFFKLLSNGDNAALVQTPGEELKKEIHEKIFEEKMQTAYRQWLESLKKDTYIDILLPDNN